MRRRVLLFAAAAWFVLGAGSALADVTVVRADLSGTRLRVEGNGARPNATMTVDGVAMGMADGAGAFRIERDPFSSSTCQITVSDGSTSTRATLSGCTPTGPGKPEFALRTENAMAGKPTRWAARGSTATSDSLAFVFEWGDGTTLRDPATGFYPVDPITDVVQGPDVTHVFAAAGTFTVRIKAIDPQGRSALSDPATVVIVPDDDLDCGVAGDAGDTHESARPVTLPVSCTGRVRGNNGVDVLDVYSFDVAQPFRLLTVTGVGLARLFPPNPPRDGAGNPIPEPVPLFFLEGDGYAWTLSQTGTWKIEVGGDGAYTLGLSTGGGGDDCVAGRPAGTVPPPIDAPNNGSALMVAEGAVDCTGTLPVAGKDRFDAYVLTGAGAGTELVAISATASIEDHQCGRKLRLFFGAPEDRLKQYVCTSHLFEVGSGADVFFGFERSSFDVGYRLRLATSTRRNGDCFSGADAPAALATAVPLLRACLGEVSATDTEDWYLLPATAGDELVLSKRPGVPLEVYDPDGVKRADNAGPVLIDKTGDWRVRVLTDKPGFAPFQGVYGLTYFFRRGLATRDCGTGADTPITGLDVTLPVSCEGDFLPYGNDPVSGPGDLSDRYGFQLTKGDILQVTLATSSPEADYTASIDAPSTSRVLVQRFGGTPVTFTHVAAETGRYTLFLERSPAVDPFDLRYSVSISKQAAPAKPAFGVSVFAPTSVTRGNTFLVETRVGNAGGPATSVTLTLSWSPAGAVRLTESPFDSFGNGVTPTASVNVGSLSSPGETAFTWALRAEQEGPATLTVTARDGPSGVSASTSARVTIQK